MLRNVFQIADMGEIEDYLSARDPKTGQTWEEFCAERGFSFDQMMKGLRMEKAREMAKRPAVHAT